MRLDRILHQVYNKPWAILPSKHQQIQKLLESHLAANPLDDFVDTEKEPFEIVGSVAVLPIEGVILNKCSTLEASCGAFSCQGFRQNLRAVAGNPSVKSIVLNISSGGGTITGVPETADLIAEISKSKPVYAYTNDYIASAAYWLASQCNGVFLSKSAEIGSVGVYLALMDITGAMEQKGVKLDLFKAGDFKAMGLAGKSLSDPERQLLQDGVDKAYREFVGYVTAKRPQVKGETMQGQMFSADDAISNGLADGIINELDFLIDYLNNK